MYRFVVIFRLAIGRIRGDLGTGEVGRRNGKFMKLEQDGTLEKFEEIWKFMRCMDFWNKGTFEKSRGTGGIHQIHDIREKR